MKLTICANAFTEKQKEEALFCAKELRRLGHLCSLYHEEEAFPVSESDLIVSIGGDGALLRAAQVALAEDKVLFGINSGRLGYLCSLSLQDISSFNETLEKCRIRERTVLEYEWKGERKLAVNDVVIGKENFGQTVDLLCRTGEEEMPVRGDGLIIATPTGSTAYNRSAGGPLLEEGQPDLAVTPICAHNPEARPLVIGDEGSVTVENRKDNAGIYADGEFIGDLEKEITVYRSKKRLQLLKKI